MTNIIFMSTVNLYCTCISDIIVRRRCS